MAPAGCNSPVLFIVFNRPETTRRVFSAIRAAAPSKLYVAADGPRLHIAGEEELCNRTREIFEQIDWECQVETLFREENVGCRRGVSEAINWFFEAESEGIILEDDCLPEPSFFQYCQELLEHYRLDSRIMSITGTCLHATADRDPHSYYFSRYPVVWGWATWRRAWSHNDTDMKLWPEARRTRLFSTIFESRQEAKFWSKRCQKVYRGEIDTWDYQWNFANWHQRGLTATPQHNLISNIGFGENATHTFDSSSHYSAMPSQKLSFPLRHPPAVVRDARRDRETYKRHYHLSLATKAANRAKSIIDALLR